MRVGINRTSVGRLSQRRLRPIAAGSDRQLPPSGTVGEDRYSLRVRKGNAFLAMRHACLGLEI